MKTLFKILFVTLISYLPMILTAQPVGALSVETIHGEVTIGALNPYSNIHFLADTDTKNFFFNKAIWTSGGEIGSYSDDLRLKTHNDTRMTILRSNGYVGIGLAAPKRNLDVRGAIRASTGNPSSYIEIAHGGSNSFINHGGAGRMDFRFAGVGKMSLKSNGKLIVGNPSLATPGDYNLYVEDGILAERVRIASKDNPVEWADYVFEEDYDLNSTKEVETFIKANKHLPNVPSAKEVGEKGVDIVEMDATLLRQIEELWLHVIELKKENETLKEKVEVLESTKR